MATVMSAFVPCVRHALKEVLRDEACRATGVQEGAGKKLIEMLEGVEHKLPCMEKKEVEDAAAKFWLDELRRAMYAVEDFVDDYWHHKDEGSRGSSSEQPARKSIFQQLGISLHRRRPESKHLKESLRDLCGMLKFTSESSAQPTSTDEQAENTEQRGQLNRSSSQQDADILYHHFVGEDDKFKALLNRLTKDDEDSNVIVLAIVGIGGIGKTTLAQKLFDNPRTRSAFDITVWLDLSNYFTNTILLSAIISAAGGNPHGLQARAELEIMLARIIEKKRVLIILDSVLHGRIYEDLLEGPLRGAARGSRILLTTRYKNIATKMKAVHIHEVKKLSYEDGWKLLYKRASLKGKEINDLKEIGEKIVERCNGIPMAIKTIGGVLRTKDKSQTEWQLVHANSAWSFKDLPEGTQGVMGTIFLSYQNLSSHLKQCFLFCSIFPENFVINQHFVAQLWISEGLVESRTDCTPEDMAKEYYNELVSRNLLQLVPGSNDITQCIMHDRVRSFVQFLTKDEIHSGNLEAMSIPAAGLCRISIVSKGLTVIPKDIERLTRLRTLLLFKNPLSGQGLDEIFRKLKFLRVLDLRATSIEKVPKSIGKLLHLRHLNLSLTRIKELPTSLTSLSNIRFLGLQSCIELRSLPDGIQNLHHIRVLDLRGTVLNLVPPGMKNLINLSLLHGFVVNSKDACQKDRNAWALEDLKLLDNLSSLEILKIERAMDRSEAREAALGSKQFLRNFELCCSNERRHAEVLDHNEATRIQGIFDELTPPQSLQSLKIVAYFGTLYPSWISASHLPNLQRIVLVDCMFCTKFPQLSQLPQLRFLSIVGSSAIKQIEQGTDSELPAFPKLEEMHIKDLQNVESWSGFKSGDLPRLRKFNLENCPKLTSLPAGLHHSSALTSMRVIHSDSITDIENLPLLKELVLHSNRNLRAIRMMPLLEQLTITSCPDLHEFDEPRSLLYLHMAGRQLVELPKWLEQHTWRLDTLSMVAPQELLLRCLPEGQDWPVIAGIAHVYARLPDRSPYFSYDREGGEVRLSHPSAAAVVAAPHGGTVVRVGWMQVLKAQVRRRLLTLLLCFAFLVPATCCFLPKKVRQGVLAFQSITVFLLFVWLQIYRIGYWSIGTLARQLSIACTAGSFKR